MRTTHGNPWRPMATRLAVTVCALAVAAVHLMRPTAKIDGVAIQALGKIAEVAPASVLELVPVWRDFLATLRKGTDRYYELSQLISSLSPARGQ